MLSCGVNAMPNECAPARTGRALFTGRGGVPVNFDQSLLDEVLDAAQAAGILGVTRQHVVHLITTGRLPAKRLTSTWITTRQAVQAYALVRRAPGRPRTRPPKKDDDCNIIDQTDAKVCKS